MNAVQYAAAAPRVSSTTTVWSKTGVDFPATRHRPNGRARLCLDECYPRRRSVKLRLRTRLMILVSRRRQFCSRPILQGEDAVGRGDAAPDRRDRAGGPRL